MPSSDEVKQSITNWCSSDDDLEITSDRFEPGTDFAFGLKSGTLSSSPVDLVVLQAAGADRVTIRRSVTLSGDNVSAANELVAQRPGSVTAAVERSGGDTSVVAQTYVYHDGLSKHTFVQAVAELARTSALLDAISPEIATTDDDTVLADMPDDGTATDSDTVAAAGTGAVAADLTGPTPAMGESIPQVVVPQPVPTPTPIPTPQPLPQPSFTPQPAQPAYSPQPYQAQPVQAQPVPQPAPAGQWAPSHSVPPQGLRAWGAPDPSGPVVANLAPGLPIQVAEVRGAWARVICSNGWTGWIDGRIIGVAA
ncbi:MAG TPA: SH3 domain-containing protein [Candidatus Acidoferrales bacterium]|nr:SH3 domain-containing protein [Candidatus Acidoferrales bacterium]